MTRRRLLIGLGGLALLAAVLLGVNEIGNARARAELVPACGCARETVDRTLEQSGELFFRFFEDDAGEVRGFMEHEVTSLCDELETELAPMRWNLGRTWTPTPDRARADRVRGILDAARPRCPDLYAEALAPLGAGREDAARACDQLFSGMAPAEAPAEPLLVWEWPSAIQRSMCLE
ncbi:MAG: hypothetical protein R3B82_05700 [Sandaracinaceae bacterium]